MNLLFSKLRNNYISIIKISRAIIALEIIFP
nr:MAG TPA: hypothetical protein [Caudoviricetes sp.]